MAVIVITPPAVEPVTLVEFKAHLNQTLSGDDGMLSRQITAARQFVERFTGKTLVSTTFELVLDAFPRSVIAIPNGPLVSVTSVKYVDATTSIETTLATAAYEVDAASNPGWIAPGDAGWPSTLSTLNAVRIRFVSGYGAAGNDVPAPLREGVLNLAANYYENREATLVGVSAAALPYGVDSILQEYREWSF